MKQEHVGAIFVVLSAICCGLLAIFVKLAYAGHINLITTLSSRFVLASIILWVVVLLVRQPISLSGKEMVPFMLLSLLGYGGAGTLFFASLQLIPASLASLVLFIHPVMVSLFELIIYRYPLSIKKIAALIMSTTGLVFVLGNVMGNVSSKGVLLALGAAVSYTAYLLYGNKVAGRHPPMVTTAFVLTFSAVGFMLFGLVTGGINLSFPLISWIWLGAMALVSTSMTIFLLFAGLKRIEAGKASIIGTLEIVVTISLSALLFGEVLTSFQILGGLMILFGIVILQLETGRKDIKTKLDIQVPGKY